MLKVAGIDHIVLRTTKLKEMLAFYCGVLGCSIERETSPEIGLTQLRAGNALIDLVSVNSELGKVGGGPPTQTGNNMDHFCLQLEPISIDDIKNYLESGEIEVGELAERFGAQGFGQSIYTHDPEGNTVELKPKI